MVAVANEHDRRPAEAVVVARHAHRVGAGGKNGDMVARRHGKDSVAAQPVAGFADRADEIGGDEFSCRFCLLEHPHGIVGQKQNFAVGAAGNAVDPPIGERGWQWQRRRLSRGRDGARDR